MTPRHATSAPKVRFAATMGEEPEVEVVLVQRSGARAFLSELLARRSSEFVGGCVLRSSAHGLLLRHNSDGVHLHQEVRMR